MAPRPILKQRSSTSTSHGTHHAVHFPPSPSLTTHTFAVYSSSAYDRSPIVVSPNSCALPERGCPGRTYTLDDPATPSPSALPKRGRSYTGDLHPRAICRSSRQQRSDPDRTPLPSLIPDLSSSESDESDAFSSPPLESAYYSSYVPLDINILPDRATSLSFHPAPPSPPYPYDLSADSLQNHKPRRRKERKRDSSRNPDRIPNSSGDNTTPPKSTKSNLYGLSHSLATHYAPSSFRIEDDGCLGGF